ncbi:MAG: type IV pilus secretin PilQ [Gammaproteobacteria bacterium]|nr:type IV pilus secretin PilQ [Gammaproteobacteria bacterium]
MKILPKILFLCFWSMSVLSGLCVADELSPQKQLIDVQFESVPTREALLLLARLANQNMSVNADVDGEVTLVLQQVPWEKALEHIVQAQGLAYRRDDDVIVVGSLADLTHEQANEEARLSQQVASLVTIPIRFGKAKAFEAELRQNKVLGSDSSLSVDDRTNALVLYAKPYEVERVKHFLDQVDTPSPQVMIEARIVEIDEQALKSLGVTFLKPGEATFTAGSLSGLDRAIGVSGSIDAPVSDPAGVLGISLAKLPAGLTLDMALQALETQGKGQVISAPHLLVENRESAYIEQGSEVPYASETANGATHVQFKKAVMGLQVTPQVVDQNQILLNLQVNKDAVSNVRLLSAKQEPLINTQEMKTQVLVLNGQTLVLGGIIEDKEDESERRVPWLGQIPGIGFLFRSQNHQKVRKEILIFVTPKIVG